MRAHPSAPAPLRRVLLAALALLAGGVSDTEAHCSEATVYFVEDGRIHKRASDESARIPGVTVDYRALLSAAGLPAVPAPPVRPRNSGFAVRRPRAASPVPAADPGFGLPGSGACRDLRGRLAPVQSRSSLGWRVESPAGRP